LDLGTPNSIHGDGSAKAISFKTPNTPLVNQSSYIPRQDKDYFDQFFKKIKVLGEGDFGEVSNYLFEIKLFCVFRFLKQKKRRMANELLLKKVIKCTSPSTSGKFLTNLKLARKATH